MERTHETRAAILQGRLTVALECLRGLASHVEFEDEKRPTIDRNGFEITWDRVEELLARDWADGPTALATTDSVGQLFASIRAKLRATYGLDLDGPLTDLEREAWTREMAIGALAAIGQLFDPVAGICLHAGEMARWRRRRAQDALVKALQLALLHGVTEGLLMADLDPVAAPCGSCRGAGRVVETSPYLGAPDVESACPDCGDGR